jgi:hypothetical protein
MSGDREEYKFVHQGETHALLYQTRQLLVEYYVHAEKSALDFREVKSSLVHD